MSSILPDSMAKPKTKRPVARGGAKGGASKKVGAFQKGNHSLNPDRDASKTKGNARSKSTIKRLLMYKGGKPIRNRDGKIVKPAAFQGWLPSGTVARVAPNQKWFGNVRTVTQDALQKFQDDMKEVSSDPYKVVMKSTKLPITLLNERAKHTRVHVLETQPFDQTFGPKSLRKRAKIQVTDLESLRIQSEQKQDVYDPEEDGNFEKDTVEGVKDLGKERVMKKGQSRRLWGELYKVIDSSDVIVQVLDARDPEGTRSKHIETFLKKEKPHKHLVLLLNKCDLIPVWVTKRWVSILSQEYPTMAFYASLRHPFGKGSLINLLRQFSKLHADRKQISVGFIGYPNVGKSSVINTLRSKKVCSVAPIAGQTKVWQYITLMKSIYLIDCPGVVYPTGETDTQTVLKGVVRIENIKDPVEYIPAILDRVQKREVLNKIYKLDEKESKWKDHIELLEKIAMRFGKLLKGGEPDMDTVSKMMLNDFHRGKIPYFLPPPDWVEKKTESVANIIEVEQQNFDEMVPREEDEILDEGQVEENENGEEKEEGIEEEGVEEEETEEKDRVPDFNAVKSAKRKRNKTDKRKMRNLETFTEISETKVSSRKTILEMSNSLKKNKCN